MRLLRLLVQFAHVTLALVFSLVIVAAAVLFFMLPDDVPPIRLLR